MTTTATFDRIMNNLTASLAELRAEREFISSVGTNAPFVIGWPQDNLYVKLERIGISSAAKIVEDAPYDVVWHTDKPMLATRFSLYDAERLTQSGNIRCLAGERAVVVTYLAALDDAIDSMNGLLRELSELMPTDN
jgi:hypothetical protein